MSEQPHFSPTVSDDPRASIHDLSGTLAHLAALAEAFGGDRPGATARADLEKALLFALPLLDRPIEQDQLSEVSRRALHEQAMELLLKLRTAAPSPRLLGPEVAGLRERCLELQSALRHPSS